MPIPDFQSLMLPLLEALADGQQRAMRDVTASLADRFDLTPRSGSNCCPAARTSCSSTAWPGRSPT